MKTCGWADRRVSFAHVRLGLRVRAMHLSTSSPSVRATYIQTKNVCPLRFASPRLASPLAPVAATVLLVSRPCQPTYYTHQCRRVLEVHLGGGAAQDMKQELDDLVGVRVHQRQRALQRDATTSHDGDHGDRGDDETRPRFGVIRSNDPCPCPCPGPGPNRNPTQTNPVKKA